MRRLDTALVPIVILALAMPATALGGVRAPVPSGEVVPFLALAPDGPPNDDLADAIALGPTGSTDGTLLGATTDRSEGTYLDHHIDWINRGDDLRDGSVWYTWTSSASPTLMTFRVTAGYFMSGYTALGIYTRSGPGLAGLTEVAYDLFGPVDGNWNASRIDFLPAPSTTYVLGIGGEFKSACQFGFPFTLTWGSPERPANDDFADALPLVDGASGRTVDATWQTGEPDTDCGVGCGNSASDLGGTSVWYVYTPASDGTTTISLFGSTFDATLGVYTGAMGSLTQVAYDRAMHGPRVSFSASSGTTYHVAVGGNWGYYPEAGQVLEWGDSGSYRLQLDQDPLTPPANDDLADAIALPAGSLTGSVAGSLVATTVDESEGTYLDHHPDYIYGGGTDLWGSSLWYTWTSPATPVPMTFRTDTPFAEGYDISLGIYTGSTDDIASLREVAFNYEAPVDSNWYASRVDFTPSPATTYVIGIGGYLRYQHGFAFELSWAPSTPPVNDDVADAVPITDGAVGSTRDATYEAGEPRLECWWGCGIQYLSDLGGATVWYTYSTAVVKKVTIGLYGSTYQASLGIYSGTLGSFTKVGFTNSMWEPELTFIAYPGTTYRIGIGGNGAYYVDGGQAVQWGDSGGYAVQLDEIVSTVPGTPGMPLVTPADGSVDLSWPATFDGNAPLTRYTVAYKPDGAADVSANWTTQTPNPSTGISTPIQSLTNGVLYDFKVRASNAVGDGPWSPVATGKPLPRLYVVPNDRGILVGSAVPPASFYTYTLHLGLPTGAVVAPSLATPPTCGSDYTPWHPATWLTISCGGGTERGTPGSDPAYLFAYGSTATLRVSGGPTFPSATVKLKGATATATFSVAAPAGSTIVSTQCKLDVAPYDNFTSCTSPFTFANVPQGTHTLTVQSTDSDGVTTTTTKTFTVKSGKVKR